MLVPELQRLTTTYDAVQDRVRLAGEAGSRDKVVLWLTRRLLDRLVAHLTRWLGRQGGEQAYAGLVQAFEQQAAAAGLEPQAPVLPDGGAPEWLVETVDVTGGPGGVVLLFKGGGGEVLARLGLTRVALRQWLGIVHALYGQGEWSLEVWPDWMGEVCRPAAAGAVALH